jgi:hypothetical protein
MSNRWMYAAAFCLLASSGVILYQAREIAKKTQSLNSMVDQWIEQDQKITDLTGKLEMYKTYAEELEKEDDACANGNVVPMPTVNEDPFNKPQVFEL